MSWDVVIARKSILETPNEVASKVRVLSRHNIASLANAKKASAQQTVHRTPVAQISVLRVGVIRSLVHSTMADDARSSASSMRDFIICNTHLLRALGPGSVIRQRLASGRPKGCLMSPLCKLAHNQSETCVKHSAGSLHTANRESCIKYSTGELATNHLASSLAVM